MSPLNCNILIFSRHSVSFIQVDELFLHSAGECGPFVNLKLLLKVFFSVVVPGHSFASKVTSNEDDLIIVIVIIFFDLPEIAIHCCDPVVVGFRLVHWISHTLVGKINLLLVGCIQSSRWVRW
jgi:hypothetical protein